MRIGAVMSLLSPLLALSVAAAPAVAGGDGVLRPPVGAGTVRVDRFPVVTAAFPDGIFAEPHVEYANYIGYRPLQLDLYVHADRAKTAARPLVIWVHGGGWSRGDGRGSGAFTDYPATLAALAAQGYVVASVDYRLSGEARFPAPVQDVKAAIRFLRSRAADYGIDPNQVILWGGSAGGHLAALAATSCGVAAFDPPASTGRLGRTAGLAAKPLPQSDCVQGAVIWYGAFDFTARPEDDGGHSTALGDNVEQLLGCRRDACGAAAREASPITHVSAQTPPMLLIVGTADEEIGYQQSERMAAALKKAGAPVELLEIADVGHGFIAKTEEATRNAHYQAFDRTLAFLNRLTRR